MSDSNMTENKQYPPIQIAFELFGEVAKLAAIQELNMRLLANKTQGIEDAAYEFSVSGTNKKIIEHFMVSGVLSEDEADLLLKSQTIRNKILHCEFNEAIKRIEKLVGMQVPGPSLKVMKFDPNINGQDLLDLLLAGQKALAEGVEGPFKDASNMKDRDLGVFGGLLHSVQTGAMDMALDIFKKSNAVLIRLAEIKSGEGLSGKQKETP